MNRSGIFRRSAAALVLFGMGLDGLLAAAQESLPSDDAPPKPPAALVQHGPAVQRGPAVERVGYVRPNLKNPNIDAPFMLVDANGAVTSYLRPAPGLRIGKYVNHRVRVRGDESALGGRAGRMIEVARVGAPDAEFELAASPFDESTAQPAAATIQQVGFNETAPPPITSEYSGAGPFVNGQLSPVPMNSPNGPMMGETYYEPSEEPGADVNLQPPGMTSPSVRWGGPGAPGCSSCGGCGQQGCGGCCDGYCGPPGFIWVRAEYLFWWTSGMNIPPLVTSGPSASQPGYIGSPGTKILDGSDRVDGYGRSGGRITLGTWLNRTQTVGIEGDYFALNNGTSSYSASSFGNPILSRPFYDVRVPTGGGTVVGQNVELVAEPGVLSGTVSANTWTAFQGAGVRGRFNLCCKQTCYDDYCCPSLNGPAGSRLDFLLGYRYLQLRDSVSINENLNTLAAVPATNFKTNDGFTTRNQFNGVDLGINYLSYRGRWSFEFIPRMAIGYNYQVANINGSTTISSGGVSTTYAGGLLAQSSNIGRYTANELAVVPELAANLGFQLTPRLRLLAGYTFIFWSQVSRAGNIIDTNVNGSTLPNSPVAASGDTRYPMFAWQNTGFWAQGVNVGLDYRW